MLNSLYQVSPQEINVIFFSLNAEKRKDPGIPNSLPFKETILREAEERKRKVRFPDISHETT